MLLRRSLLLALVGLSACHEKTPTDAIHDAEHALAKLDPHSAHEALAARCADAGTDASFAPACAALRQIDEGDPLASASRLAVLTREGAGGDALSELQTIRVELLIRAGHSREAAHEGQRWAEQPREPGIGAVRLWLAAARAQAAIGDEERAQADAQRARELAAHVR